MSETVELHNAFMWDCPFCGKEQFTRCITRELNPEEKAEINNDVPDELKEAFDFGGEYLFAPKQVKCGNCGNAFKSYHQNDKEPE